MVLANENYIKSPDSQYIEEIEKRINAFKVLHPEEKIYRLDAISPTFPLPKDVIAAMRRAIDDLEKSNTFRTYAPVQGYDFLVSKILKEYRSIYGFSLEKESVFVNSGSTTDLANIINVIDSDNIVAFADTIDPIYENSTVFSGQSGKQKDGKWQNIVYLKCNETTKFIPQLPTERVDVIYLSNPNNVTGTAINRTELKHWVDYALENKSLIIYDSSFCDFIKAENVPHSIYEIKGAKKVAIEVRSFSKSASFAGIRCGCTIVPVDLQVFTVSGKTVSINKLWRKFLQNYTNGVSYISQRGAEALFTQKSKIETSELVDYYLTNASLIYEELLAADFKVFGGQNSPYVWFKIPNGENSWKFFIQLLHDYKIVGTPGIIFGKENDNYMRFSGYCSRTDLMLVLKIIKENY